MPDNTDAAKQLAALAPNSNALEEIREIDLSDLGELFKDCKIKVRVNPPAIFDMMLNADLEHETPARDKVLRVLKIFTDIPIDDLNKWNDPLLYAVFYRARGLYWDYWGELRKNSRAQ